MLINLSLRRTTGAQDLVDLLGRCHLRIRHFVALACEIAHRREASPDQVTQACADAARYFSEALPLHIADEEESIAPRLRGLRPEVDDALDAMSAQHGHHAPQLELLLCALAEVRRAPFDENARAELAAVAGPLKAEFEEHLALEERLIFPVIRQTLPQETQALIIDELRRRRRAPRRETRSGATQEDEP